jgi:hypothetical protein
MAGKETTAGKEEQIGADEILLQRLVSGESSHLVPFPLAARVSLSLSPSSASELGTGATLQ